MRLSIVVYAQSVTNDCLEATLSSIKGCGAYDYEVVIVDDGSEQNYSELAQKYGAKYVKTQKRGAFAQKLYAIEIVNGEYVSFLDAGNTVTFNFYTRMLGEAQKVDGVVCSGIAYVQNGVKFTYNQPEDDRSILANKIYKLDVLKAAKKQLEKTDITLYSMESGYERAINTAAFNNTKAIFCIRTGLGYVFLDVNEENVDALACAKNTLVAAKELSYENSVVDSCASALCTVAKAQKQKALIPELCTMFGKDKIKPVSKAEANGYGKIEYFGENFADVEKALKKIAQASNPITVMYEGTSLYETESLNYIQSQKPQGEGKPLTLMIPKRICKKKTKLKALQMAVKNIVR